MGDEILRLKKMGWSHNKIATSVPCAKSTVSYYTNSSVRSKAKQRSTKNKEKVARYIRSLKEENPCKDCNVFYPYYVMDFDHLGDKEFNISDGIKQRLPLQEILDEIVKCDCVCANCHRIRGHKRRTGELQEDEYIVD